MKLKLIVFLGLIALGCKDIFCMQWLGADKAVKDVINVFKSESGGDGDTILEVLQDITRQSGRSGREEVRQIMRTAKTEIKNTIAGVLGTNPDLNAAEGVKQWGSFVRKEVVGPIITDVQNCQDSINDFLGVPRDSTLPQAINAKCQSLGKKMLIGGAAVSAVVVAYYLFNKFTHPGSLNRDNLNKSTLLVESSGFTNGLMSKITNLFKAKTPLKKVILAPNISAKAKDAIKNFATIITNLRRNSVGLKFKSLLLNGPKGTGKTLLIDNFIKLSNLDYIKINSSTFINFEDGTESKAISTLFGLLKKPKKGIIVVIEEADILLNRPAYKNKLMDLLRWIKANNHQFMLIVSAEQKKLLDYEILSLIDQNIELSLPEEQERKKYLSYRIAVMLKEYHNTGLGVILSSLFTGDKIEEIARSTDGFSYANLSLLVDQLKLGILRNNNKFTKELINNVVKDSLDLKATLSF